MSTPEHNTSDDVLEKTYICRVCKRTECSTIFPMGWFLLRQRTPHTRPPRITHPIGTFCSFECVCSYVFRRYSTMTVQKSEARLVKMLDEASHE